MELQRSIRLYRCHAIQNAGLEIIAIEAHTKFNKVMENM